MNGTRRYRRGSTVAAVIVLGSLSLLSASCARSASSLRNAAEGKDGVIDVEVVDNGGEDDIPFSSLPQLVTVTMKSSATEDQVQDVTDEYEDGLSEGYVETLTIKLAGHVTGTLELGRATPDTDPFVDAFVAAAHRKRAENVFIGTDYGYDDDEGNELFLHYASLTLRSTDFKQVQAAFKALEPKMEPKRIALTVSSDGFRLTAGGKPSARDRAQLRVAAKVDARFGLVGAVVVGHKQAQLRVRSGTDVRAVRQMVEQLAPNSSAGEVAIGVGDTVDLSRAPIAQREHARQVANRLRSQPGFRSATYRNGELRIIATNLNIVLGVDGLVRSSLEFEPSNDPELEKAYLPLAVRYLLPHGTVILKKPGATVNSYLDTSELPRQGWVRVTITAAPSGAHLRLYAPAHMSRADGRYYADNFAEGRADTPPLHVVVTWPSGSGKRALVVDGH